MTSILIATGRLRTMRRGVRLPIRQGWRGSLFLTARPGCRRLLHSADRDLARLVVRIADRPAGLTAQPVDRYESHVEHEPRIWAITTLAAIAVAVIMALRVIP
jgi:hypothetical protein